MAFQLPWGKQAMKNARLREAYEAFSDNQPSWIPFVDPSTSVTYDPSAFGSTTGTGTNGIPPGTIVQIPHAQPSHTKTHAEHVADLIHGAKMAGGWVPVANPSIDVSVQLHFAIPLAKFNPVLLRLLRIAIMACTGVREAISVSINGHMMKFDESNEEREALSVLLAEAELLKPREVLEKANG